jgi:hypothetical protein
MEGERRSPYNTAREVINKYELYHKGAQGKAEAMKAYVLLTVVSTSSHLQSRTAYDIRHDHWERIPRVQADTPVGDDRH